MAANEILVENKGPVLSLTFNRPEVQNAMGLDMANHLHMLAKNATTDKGVRCVLLRGAGDHFMNGIDLTPFQKDYAAAVEITNKVMQPYHAVIREFRAMDKPVVAAVQGNVSGSGFSLILAADLVIASDDAVFTPHFADLGLSPDGACSYFLPRKIGAARALEILMLNKSLTSQQAMDLGLVNRIVPRAELAAASDQWATQLAEGPTKAFGAMKKLVMHSFEQDLNAQLGIEHSYYGASLRSFDFRAAVRALFSNTEPKFTGA